MYRLLFWGVAPGLLLLLCTVVALAFYLRSDDFQVRVGQAASLAVHAATGEELQPGKVEIRWFPPAITLNDVRLVHPETDEIIVHIPWATVPIDLWGLGAGAIEVRQPTVLLHLDRDGLREFRGLKRGEGGGLKRLPLKSLRIERANLQLQLPDGRIQSTFTLLPSEGSAHDLLGQLLVEQHDFIEVLPLDIPGILLGPTSIVVPPCTIEGASIRVDASATLPLSGPVLAELDTKIDLDALDGLLTAPRVLHGDVELAARIQGPVIDAHLQAHELGADLPGLDIPLLTYELGDADVRLQLDGLLDIDALHWSWGGGSIDAVAVIDPTSKTLLEAEILGEGVHLRRILMAMDVAPNPWIDFEAEAQIVASGSLDPLLLTGDFFLDTRNLRVTNQPVHLKSSTEMLDIRHARARGSLTLDKQHILLNAPWIRGPVTKASAEVSIGFGPRGPLDAQIDAWGAHLADFQPLGGVELGGDGSIRGRLWGPFNKLQFDGRGDLRNFSVLGLPFADHLVAPIFRSDMKSLEIADASATVGSSVYTGVYGIDFRPPLSMHANLDLANARIEDITGIFVDIKGLAGAAHGHLDFDGPLDAMNANADFRFSDIGLWGERFDKGVGVGRMRDGVFRLEQGSVERHQGEERVALTGTVQDAWSLDMQLDTEGFRFERLDAFADLELPITGAIDVSTRLNNTLFMPDPQGWATATDLVVAGRSLPDSRVDFRTLKGLLNLEADVLGEAAHATGTVPLFEDQPYLIRADLDEVPLHLFYPEGADGSPIRAVASGSLQVAGTVAEGWPPRSLFADLDPVQLQWGRHHLQNQTPWALRLEDEVLQIERFDLHDENTTLSLMGQVGDSLELNGQGHVDLDLLRAVVPGLTRSEGDAVFTLRTKGKDGQVQTRVNVDIDASLLRHDAAPIAFEDVTGKLRLQDDLFVFESVKGALGGGSIQLDGRVQAESWIPTRYDLRANVEDAQVQWVTTLPPAIGDATLVFDGPARALLLSGDVQLTEMVFADRIDWEDWVIEYREDVVVDAARPIEDDAMFDLDIQIEADRTIQLRNNLAEGDLSADLRIIGSTARAGLLGEIRVDDAVVFIQDRTFRVDRGEITYRDPWTWDPDIDFELVTDVRRRDQRYRISYQIYGPFSDWRTASRSEPALPQADVNSLLWFGVTTEDLQQAGELPTAVAQGVADLLLTDLFASTQAGELGEVPDLLFDSIDVATGVNGRGEYSSEPRLVVRKRLEEFADVELLWEFNLGRPEDNYVRVDKRISDVWNIAGWYATLQRDRVLPIGGAYGVDLAARWEIE